MTMHTAKVKSFSEYGFTPVVNAPAFEDFPHLNLAVDRVHAAAPIFAKLTFDERIDLARSMQQGYLRIAEGSVLVACKAKGITPGTPLEGEEWATGPVSIVRHLRLIREQLESIQRTGTTKIGPVAKRPDGRLSVRVFPASTLDAVLMNNVSIDVHLQPHVTRGQLDRSRARFFKQPDHDGRTILVLGAGNFASIPVMDVLTTLFNEGKVCVLKMNPVNAYLGPFIEEAFRAAIDHGFLAVVYGGIAEGKHLVHHPKIDEVHITGSDRTYEAIVWGPDGPERDKRMVENKPLMSKPITAELGNVSPVIIAPGPYTAADLRYMAEDAAGYLTMNASFLCCAAKILVLPKGWPHRDEFMAALADVLKKVAPRKAYYPGAAERFATFVNNRPSVMRIGAAAADELPWTIVSGLDAENAAEPFFTTESFCSILGETAVGGNDPAEFLKAAVDFANDRLWGTLTATLVVHPAVMKANADAVENALSELRYGTVCLNAFPGMSFGFANAPWGAYPGSTPQDIQSGNGWVHNTAMLENIEKVVARFPFRSFPKPMYFPSHRTVNTAMRRMTALEENGSWLKAIGVIAAAMRG
jgi:acyl-CoA reductase-like NAD-dependent aldehyde dehydrogenase